MAAAQNLVLPAPVGRHFWDRDTAAFTRILQVANKGSQHDQEDVVCHMWTAIVGLYYGSAAVNQGAPRWDVIREAYRGLIPFQPSQQRPDVAAVIAYFIAPPAGQMVTLRHRDGLWVECKAANKDNPSGWRNLMNETVVRLNNSHPTRQLFLIFAIGIKAMVFLWDPVTPRVPGAAGLFIRGRGRVWTLDPRIRHINLSQWHNPVTQEVDPSQALDLDCWTTTPGGALRNGRMLLWLDRFLAGSSQIVFPGVNPGVW